MPYSRPYRDSHTLADFTAAVVAAIVSDAIRDVTEARAEIRSADAARH